LYVNQCNGAILGRSICQYFTEKLDGPFALFALASSEKKIMKKIWSRDENDFLLHVGNSGNSIQSLAS
jgi:hypothetical protein